MRFNGSDYDMPFMADEVSRAQTQAAGSVHHDTLVEDPVEQVDEFSAGGFAHQSHVEHDPFNDDRRR